MGPSDVYSSESLGGVRVGDSDTIRGSIRRSILDARIDLRIVGKLESSRIVEATPESLLHDSRFTILALSRSIALNGLKLQLKKYNYFPS